MADDPNAGTPPGGTPAGGEPAPAVPPTDPATSTDPAPSPSSADPAPTGTAPADPPADPPANDWASLREKYAKGDEKVLKRLSRYSSPEAVMDALLAAQNKIASGGLKEALPENPTPEELSAWREANGVPADPSEYDLTLPDNLVIGEHDQPVVEEFTKLAHSRNLKGEDVKELLGWYFKQQEAQLEEIAAQDRQTYEDAQKALREEWGSEYKLNQNLVLGLLEQAPETIREMLPTARLPDGTLIGNHPEALRWLANLAREINPVATVVPGAGNNAPQAIASELASINKMMGDKNSDYWKGPRAAELQERYRQLLTAQEKYQSRQ